MKSLSSEVEAALTRFAPMLNQHHLKQTADHRLCQKLLYPSFVTIEGAKIREKG